MKNKPFIALSALLFTVGSTSSMASNNVCSLIDIYAKNVMEIRQMGGSMSDLMGMVDDGDYKDLYETIIISAFEVPRYNTEKNKQNAISDFTNKQYLECVKAYKD